MADVLVVDDEPAICWGLGELISELGHTSRIASSAEEGLALAQSAPPDVLVLDVRLPGQDGLTAIPAFREALGERPIIVITAFGDLETAVRAVAAGVFEYVLKPFSLSDIRSALSRALAASDVPSPAVAPTPTPALYDTMLGESPAIQAVFRRIALAADSDVSVLLYGESGVGKELAARAIHAHSRRQAGPFVAVNLAALSPTLAEAELFGHVAGAFTGAERSRKGHLVHADGGVLLLDEVADIPLAVQVKLLRALDRGEVLAVGADRPVTTHLRVISATHRDLSAEVEAGRFRHDLFFRLGAFTIEIPPLRERPGDISLLAQRFVEQFSGGATHLAAATLAELERRPWYGNVRELRNAIEHAVVLARQGAILPSHLPASQGLLSPRSDNPPATQLPQAITAAAERLLADPTAQGAVYQRLITDVEGPLLETAMRLSGDSCSAAARALGLHRTTLRKKLDELGMKSEE